MCPFNKISIEHYDFFSIECNFVILFARLVVGPKGVDNYGVLVPLEKNLFYVWMLVREVRLWVVQRSCIFKVCVAASLTYLVLLSILLSWMTHIQPVWLVKCVYLFWMTMTTFYFYFLTTCIQIYSSTFRSYRDVRFGSVPVCLYHKVSYSVLPVKRIVVEYKGSLSLLLCVPNLTLCGFHFHAWGPNFSYL